MQKTCLDRLRILEIGEFRLFRNTLPAQTVRFTTRFRGEPDGHADRPFDAAALAYTLRALRAHAFDLVVCYAPAAGIRRPGDGVVRGSARRLAALLFGFRRLAPQVLRVPTAAAMAVLDFADEPLIGRHAFFLLERCTHYFKRSLPHDPAMALLGPASPFASLPAVHRSPFYRRIRPKLRPISVGVPGATLAALPREPVAKQMDVFFSGAVHHSTVRERGHRILDTLRGRGVSLDLADGEMPRDAYLRRMAGARLAWSPEGYGWDGFRHYEALAAGTVPVINYPSGQRYAPLVDGRHCRYYDPQGGDLADVVTDALRDPERLAVMAAEGRAHVMAHLTPLALCEYVAASCGVLA